MNGVKVFQRVVSASSLLTSEQKDVLLEEPSKFSDAYRKRLVKVLSVYEQGQKKRYGEIKKKLETIRAQFERDMEKQGIPMQTRDIYIRKLRDATSSLTV